MSHTGPTIYVLAGPNGAGKTSLYWHEASGIPRLNGDTLYQQHQNLHEVEAALRQQQEEWVSQKRSFVIETNAASTRDYILFSWQVLGATAPRSPHRDETCYLK